MLSFKYFVFLLLSLYDIKESECTPYGHLMHTALSVSTDAPPTCCLRGATNPKKVKKKVPEWNPVKTGEAGDDRDLNDQCEQTGHFRSPASTFKYS